MKDTFIRTYKVFSPDFCEEVIEIFEQNKEMGCVTRRNDGVRKDNQLDFNPTAQIADNYKDKNIPQKQRDLIDLRSSSSSKKFFKVLNECIQEYIEELGLQKIVGEMYCKNMLVQGYEADNFESYSTWHCESGTLDTSDRAFVYMLYLNDDFEGGETEFMFQQHKEKPVQGKLVIWPASYTHVHRGAMLQSGSKYIATGWSFYVPTQY